MLTTQAYCESINHKSLASTMGQTCDYKEGQSLSSLISLTPGDGGFLRDIRGQTSLAVLTGPLPLLKLFQLTWACASVCVCAHVLAGACAKGKGWFRSTCACDPLCMFMCMSVRTCLQARVLRGRGGSESHVLVILRE